MSILFVILVILASVVLALFVLVQNPKGGGLSGNIAGFSNQLMGVKQTTDVLEKGTWIFAGIIGLLCLVSALFIRGGSGDGLPDNTNKATGATVPGAVQQTPAAPAQEAPANTVTVPGVDSVPK